MKSATMFRILALLFLGIAAASLWSGGWSTLQWLRWVLLAGAFFLLRPRPADEDTWANLRRPRNLASSALLLMGLAWIVVDLYRR